MAGGQCQLMRQTTSVGICWQLGIIKELLVLGSSPGHTQFFNVATLKNLVWPGDEASIELAEPHTSLSHDMKFIKVSRIR